VPRLARVTQTRAPELNSYGRELDALIEVLGLYETP
jgi:hypothetical protein